jgi:hypothetical protein
MKSLDRLLMLCIWEVARLEIAPKTDYPGFGSHGLNQALKHLLRYHLKQFMIILPINLVVEIQFKKLLPLVVRKFQFAAILIHNKA